jgi:acyl-CoA dehydrogenase
MTEYGTYTSSWHTDETMAIASVATKFFEHDIAPRAAESERQHRTERSLWHKAGSLGLFCLSVPEEYGGGGGTFAHDLAVFEAQGQVQRSNWGNMVHSGIVAHYVLAYGTEQQKQRWLPAMARGELVAAVAMTEPAAGSDLRGIRTRAVRDGDEYVINGSKTFITNGGEADLLLLAAQTDPDAGSRGISLIGVETKDLAGFTPGRSLDKLGQHAVDTSELFFDAVRVPVTHLLGGKEGHGLAQLMQQLPQERLLIGMTAVTAAELAVRLTTAHVKGRQAFGQTIFDFQNTKFVLAEAETKAHIGRVFLDSCIERHLRGELDATTAAMCKWWLTEMQGEVLDACLQLFGGYGYMTEYPIARMYADARVQRIYGGATEVMKELISRAL